MRKAWMVLAAAAVLGAGFACGDDTDDAASLTTPTPTASETAPEPTADATGEPSDGEVTGEARALVLDLGGRNGPDGIIIGLSADVLFDSGSSEIKPAADATLAKVARLTQLIRRDSILITGHTDNVGSGPSNQRLSRDRAQAVADALKDADAEIGGRAVVRGAGERQPVASNATDEGRAQNRRVEIVFRGARFRP